MKSKTKRSLAPVTKCKNCGARIVFIVDEEDPNGRWYHTGYSEEGELVESDSTVGCKAEPEVK